MRNRTFIVIVHMVNISRHIESEFAAISIGIHNGPTQILHRICEIACVWNGKVVARNGIIGGENDIIAALEAYTKADGALYYEINSEKPDSVRFWKSLGFTENGTDEYGMPLFIRR